MFGTFFKIYSKKLTCEVETYIKTKIVLPTLIVYEQVEIIPQEKKKEKKREEKRNV